MSDVVTEHERKYEIPDDAGLPDLAEVPGVVTVSDVDTDELTAVYYDAPDLRLARTGATLRRREGGSDSGWHLKIPAGEDIRTEYHAPLGKGAAGRPPRRLAGLLGGVLRGATLVPVATIATDRRRRTLYGPDGAALAEVTDDRVRAQVSDRPTPPVRWREVEVELAAGADAAVLDQVDETLLRAGLCRSSSSAKLSRVLSVEPARPDPMPAKPTAGELVIAYLRTQVQALATQDLLARRGTDDALHQLRVAIRRIRAVLRVYGKIIDRDATRLVERDLRRLGRALSTARDLEVLEKRCVTAVSALPDELVLGPVRKRLTRHFGPARADAERAALRALDSDRYFRVRDDLDALLADPPLTAKAGRRARKELPKHLRRAYRTVAKRAAAVADGGEEVVIHRFRKAAKRLRYAAECAEPVGGAPVRRIRKRATALTKPLGRFQDGAVARPVLRQLGLDAHLASDNGFTYGLLLGQDRAAVAAQLRDTTEAWQRLHARRGDITRSWKGA